MAYYVSGNIVVRSHNRQRPCWRFCFGGGSFRVQPSQFARAIALAPANILRPAAT